MHKITIEEVDGTYIVEIGCKHHIFMTVDALISDVGAYIKNPVMVEKKWHNAKKYVQIEKESQVKRPEDYQQPVYCESANAVPPPGRAKRLYDAGIVLKTDPMLSGEGTK